MTRLLTIYRFWISILRTTIFEMIKRNETKNEKSGLFEIEKNKNSTEPKVIKLKNL